METPIYTVFYFDYNDEIHKEEIIANDHSGVLVELNSRSDVKDVFLIFIGHIPEPIWMG